MGMSYVVENNTIVIIPIDPKGNTKKKIKGTIKDSKGEPVIGATILEKEHPMVQLQIMMEILY